MFTLFSSRLLNPTDGHCLISNILAPLQRPQPTKQQQQQQLRPDWLGGEEGLILLLSVEKIMAVVEVEVEVVAVSPL